MAKQDDWVRLTVRLPPELYQDLTEQSARGGASINAEIVGRLQSSFTDPARQFSLTNFDALANAIAVGLYDRFMARPEEDKDVAARRILLLERLANFQFDDPTKGAEKQKKIG